MKKKTKLKMIATMLAMALVVASMPLSVYAVTLQEQEPVEISGVRLEPSQVTSFIESGDAPVTQSAAPKLSLNDISFSGNRIEIDAALNGQELQLEGTLYKSFREEANGKILVGEVEDQEAGIRSAYLEINSCDYDSTDPQSRLVTNCWVFDDSLTFEKTFLLYLIDEDGNWYVFESKLADVPIAVTEINRNQLEVAEMALDTGWYMPYINVVTTEIPYTPPQTRAAHSYTNGLGVITERMTLYGVVSIYTLYPYCEGTFTDVGNTGQFTSTLKVVQTVTIDGQDMSSNHNMHMFQVRPHTGTGRLGCSFAAGQNTTFLSRDIGYKLYKTQSNQTNYVGAVTTFLGTLSSFTGVSAAYNLITNTLTFINQLKGNSTSSLINNNTHLNISPSRPAVSVTFGSDVALCCSSTYIDVSVNCARINDLSTDTATYGAVNWQYSVYYNGNYYNNYLLNQQVNYTVYKK